MDKATIKHQRLKSNVNIILRTLARRLENWEGVMVDW
jgi:hypothetical protein